MTSGKRLRHRDRLGQNMWICCPMLAVLPSVDGEEVDGPELRFVYLATAEPCSHPKTAVVGDL